MFGRALKWVALVALQQLASAQAPASPPAPSPPSSPGGLETGALIGIIVGSVAGAILLIYLIYGFYAGMKMGGTFAADPLMLISKSGAVIGSRAPGADGLPLTTVISPATVNMGVPQQGGEPGLYAVVEGNRWFWSVGAAK